MFININDIDVVLSQYNKTDRINIQDVVPQVNGTTQIPNYISWYGMFANVRNANATDLTQVPVEYNVYEHYINQLLAYMMSLGYQNVGIVDTIPNMYTSYVALANETGVAGVINITKTPTGKTDIYPFDFDTVGTTSMTVDIMTFWNTFMMIYPRGLSLYTGIKDMYSRYVKCVSKEISASSVTMVNMLLARHYDIGTLASEMNTIVNSTLVDSEGKMVKTQDLINIVRTNGKTEINLSQYYAYMYNAYKIDPVTALDMLQYTSDMLSNINIYDRFPKITKVSPFYVTPSAAIEISSGVKLI